MAKQVVKQCPCGTQMALLVDEEGNYRPTVDNTLGVNTVRGKGRFTHPKKITTSVRCALCGRRHQVATFQ